MKDFMAHNAKFVVDWGQPILIVVIIGGIAILYAIGRGNRFLLPKGVVSWIGALIVLCVLGFSSLMMYVLSIENPQTGMILEQFEALTGKEAPDLAFTLIADDSIHTIDEYKGSVLVLNLWATWCTPCLREMPDFDRLQRAYQDRGVKVIALSDESREKVQRFVDRHSMSIHIGYVKMFEWAGTDLGSVRPVTFLVDRDGIVREYFTGAYDYDFYESQIEPLLNP